MADKVDALIEKQLKDEDLGLWHDDDNGLRVYTPNPSFFEEVTAYQLLNYFMDKAPEEPIRLNLP